MMDFIVLALGVMVGSLGAGCVALGVMLNKRILKAYTKYILEVSEDIQEELLDKFLDEEFNSKMGS